MKMLAYATKVLMLLSVTLWVACSSPEPVAEPEAPVDTTEVAAAIPDGPSAEDAKKEGSAPKSELEPAGEEGVMAEETGVDNSIREAGEFGDDALLEGLAPPGWNQVGDIEHYNVATLYNKINGRSELYMAYDVVGLSWVSFAREGDSSNFIDLFIYDMRTPTGAFGIFSVEREADQEPIEFGRDGYQTGSNYYFWKGKYYGYINASQENDENSAAGHGVLLALMQRIPDEGGDVRGLDWLPEEGLAEDTVQYFKVDAMSLDFLTDTFLGMYTFGEDTGRAFVSKRETEENATEIVTAFEGYGNDYGDSVESVTIDGVDVKLVNWGGGFYDAMYRVGNTVAGLNNVEGRDRAERMLEKLVPVLR